MFWSLTAVLFLCCLQGGESAATEDGALDNSMTKYQALGGVLLLISLVALVALCAGGGVAPGNPIPNWVMTISPDPSLDVGITGTSDGINAINNNCVHRHRMGTFETDGARWGAALSKGKHVFEIYWPSGHRGTSATVGVGSEDAPLFVKPKDSLVGCNGFSWGLDIARKRLLHRGEMLGTMPRGGVVPDKFYMYVDCDGGTLGFGTDHSYWGAPVNIPRAKFPVYPMIGVMCHNAQVTMIYRGSENRNNAPHAITSVMVPSTGPGGQLQVHVVNPGTMQTGGAQGYGQQQPAPGYGQQQPAPGYGQQPPPYQPPAYQQPPPAEAGPVEVKSEAGPVEEKSEAGPAEDKSETHVAPIMVSGT